METSRREKAGLIAFAMLTAFVVVSCVQTKTPQSSGITFHEAGAAGAAPASASPVPSAENSAPVPAGVPAPNITPAAEIVVHITGAVKKPGVYHLPQAARGDDALKAAGGATSDANPDALNLAAHLEDGSQIHVPTKQEAKKEQAASSAPASSDSFVKHDPAAAPKSDKAAGKSGAKSAAPHSAAHGRSGTSAKLKPDSGVKINLNTADAQTLQKLPGIGPSMADRILDYRKANGGFKNPEELMEVSGIGPKEICQTGIACPREMKSAVPVADRLAERPAAGSFTARRTQ